jgi:hypothetical protein
MLAPAHKKNRRLGLGPDGSFFVQHCAMTTAEFCRTAGHTERELQNWIDNGLLDAERVRRTGGAARREFTAGQVERARLIKALCRARARN